MDVPVAVGFCIHQLSKAAHVTVLLQLHRQYIEMGTDSAYMALSGLLKGIIKRDLRTSFWEE